jgi:hypothetical protein
MMPEASFEDHSGGGPVPEFVVWRKDVPHIVLVDDEDVALFVTHRWFVGKNGYVMRNPVRRRGHEAPGGYLHRDICGLQPGDRRVVDHDNRNKLDNRRSNLLVVTHQRNMQNQIGHRDASTSEYRGVSFDRINGAWKAAWMNDGAVMRKNCATEAEAVAVVRGWRGE